MAWVARWWVTENTIKMAESPWTLPTWCGGVSTREWKNNLSPWHAWESSSLSHNSIQFVTVIVAVFRTWSEMSWPHPAWMAAILFKTPMSIAYRIDPKSPYRARPFCHTCVWGRLQRWFMAVLWWDGEPENREAYNLNWWSPNLHSSR